MESELKIPINQVKIFMWKFTQDETHLMIKIDSNEENKKDFDVSFEQDNTILKCTLSGAKYPIIRGRLYGKITETNHYFDGQTLCISLKKQDPQEWPYVIDSPIDAETGLDFNSMFLKYLADPTNEDLKQQAEHSIKVGFIPAILHFAKKEIDAGNITHAEEMLDELIYVHNDVDATLLLGEAYMETGNNMAIHVLASATRKNCAKAAKMLGDIYSPVTKYNFSKDADMSLQYYRQAIEMEDADSMVAAAQLIDAGQAPSTNILDPVELYQHAKTIDPKIIIPERPKKTQTELKKPAPKVEQKKAEPAKEKPAAVKEEVVKAVKVDEKKPEGIPTKVLVIGGIAAAAVVTGLLFGAIRIARRK